MTYLDWQGSIGLELKHAQTARANGNEGMARVCARRAAGIAAGEFLKRNHLSDPGPSVIDRLKCLYEMPNTSPASRYSIECLLQRVNRDFELPAEIDLIEETQKFIASILPEYQDFFE
jgi:hypothetical protein